MGEDVKAKLLGYAAELQHAIGRKLDERASAIEEQIKALEGPARAEVARLRTAADGHQALNQDAFAADRRREADELEALLPEVKPTATKATGKAAATDKGN